MNEKLKQATEAWAIKKDYSRSAMPEVVEYNKRYRKETGLYPYNSHIKEFILKRETIEPELIDMLETEIYLSQRDIRNEGDEANKVQMIAEGWKPLDKAIAAGKLLQVSATTTNDWCTAKIDKTYKPHIFNKGGAHEQYGLMKPRARTHGYALYQFDNAFCKLV